MDKLRILVTTPHYNTQFMETFFTKRVREQLDEIGEVIYHDLDHPYTPEELRDALVDIDIAITGWGSLRFDEEVLSKANRLKIVAHTGGTVQNLVSDALYKKGVMVLSANPVYAESVAEACLCYMMCSLRSIKYFALDGPGWRGNDEDSEKGLMDRTVGIIGFGMIAKYLMKMLQPFHVTIKICSEYATPEAVAQYGATVVDLDEIFETCDIISVNEPLNPKTYHMVKEEHFKKMQDGALIVNTARGAVIDEPAMVKELQTGRIFAALDVYEVEPLPDDSPLRTLPNVLCLPHVGGPTFDRREYSTMALIRDIKKWMNGETELECQISQSYAANMTIGGYKPGMRVKY